MPLNNPVGYEVTKKVGVKEIKKPHIERFYIMQPQCRIPFSCPDHLNKKEFIKQIKGQERGLNKQSIAKNIENRKLYQERKELTGNGRAIEGSEAQLEIREKVKAQRIEYNQEHGMNYTEAKAEAEKYLQGKAALHDPDQIAGGDPAIIERLGDSAVNSSIGSQWKVNVKILDRDINKFIETNPGIDLNETKLNVKLYVV